MIKKVFKIIIGKQNFEKLRVFLNRKILSYYFKKNYRQDFDLFVRDSTVFHKDNYNKIETHIILHYHSLEKGFLHQPIRPKFGKAKVKELLDYLKNNYVIPKLNNSQIQAALLVLLKYYEYHQNNSINIEDYYRESDYQTIKEKYTLSKTKPIINKTKKEVFSFTGSDFKDFSKSRHSIRNYSGKIISNETISECIDIAKTAPSVCNRQGIKVYLVNDQTKVNELVKLQGGLAGFEKNINQLLIVTGNRNYYYAIGERHQLFVDGGLFIMNLLYALHYKKVAACPAHWCYEEKYDEQVRPLINMSSSEKIVTFITIGEAIDDVNVTLSLRRDTNEVLNIIE